MDTQKGEVNMSQNNDKEKAEQELKFIEQYAMGADFGEVLCREQLRALWTAYCLHYNLICDTREYDWLTIVLWDDYVFWNNNGGWQDIDDFDLFMGSLLS